MSHEPMQQRIARAEQACPSRAIVAKSGRAAFPPAQAGRAHRRAPSPFPHAKRREVVEQEVGNASNCITSGSGIDGGTGAGSNRRAGLPACLLYCSSAIRRLHPLIAELLRRSPSGDGDHAPNNASRAVEGSGATVRSRLFSGIALKDNGREWGAASVGVSPCLNRANDRMLI